MGDQTMIDLPHSYSILQVSCGNPNSSIPESWRPQPPFWYKEGSHLQEPNWPVGDPDEYRFKSLPYPLTGKTLLEEMEIERPERYLPGEIYRNQRPKKPVEDLSKTANCPKIWEPKDPGFYCEFQPTPEMLNPPSLLYDILQRKAETKNSYDLSGTPQVKGLIQCCEGVEDLQTKAAKRPDYLEGLSLANTRPVDFMCAPDTDVKFENACKISDSTVKIPPKTVQKIKKFNNDDFHSGLLSKKENVNCKCNKNN